MKIRKFRVGWVVFSLGAAAVLVYHQVKAAEPSFDCTGVADGSIEAMICQDEELAALDNQLSEVYKRAVAKATNEHPPTLKAEQRGWVKGRNECWKADDKKSCVESEYQRRIAELQARYGLIQATATVTYLCTDQPGSEVIVTYFPTDPPTLIAERGDSVSLMYQQESASGTKYAGRNESLWEHQGEAIVTWGYGAPELQCKLQQ
ncbi:MliC family protein [Photobacterium sp. WH77]|uniref:MliC family protein n=1 Tax=unclassified Photobacterium TaxID=2628852 RepID=UPI001ED9F379|nr:MULTISPECIES: MliC family protein [unclassified Photobacterium]MCG2837468.1 MliC family protein [Photobacterium sp. WH77]MCG2844962.1 MliC family protein [Photobacterium sp. WH80]